MSWRRRERVSPATEAWMAGFVAHEAGGSCPPEAHARGGWLVAEARARAEAARAAR